MRSIRSPHGMGLFCGFLRIPLLFRLLLACALLVGCAGAQEAAAPAPDLVAAAPDGIAGQALQAAADVYQQAAGVRVHVELYPENAYSDTLSAELLAGSQRFDLVYLPADTLPGWAAYHALRPMEMPADRALEPWLPALTVDGQLYGLPTQPDPLVLWYRGDLHEQAGLPHPARDWETFRANAQALNAPPERYGAAVAGGEGEAGLVFAALLAGYGGQAVGGPPDYVVQVDGPAGQKALDFYTGLHAGGLIAPQAERYTRGDVVQALVDGRAAAGIAPLLSEGALSEPALAAAHLPGVEPQTALGDLAAWSIPLRAPHPQAAEQFATWLVSADGALAWAQGGGLPAHRGVLAALPAGAPPVSAEMARALSEIDRYRTVFPPVLHNDLMLQALHEAAREAAAGQALPGEALARAANEMRQALVQGGTVPPVGEEE